MKICPACGQENGEFTFHCKNCGKPLYDYSAHLSKPVPPSPSISFLNDLMLILGTTFSLCGLSAPYLSTKPVRLQPDQTCSIFTIILASLAILLSVVHLEQQIKSEAETPKILKAVLRMVSSAALLAVGIVMVS